MSAAHVACSLCRRITKRGTNEHHLIPRTCHSNKWFRKNFTREQMRETIDVCYDCHSAIHSLIPDEKELGRHYHTIDKLLMHEDFAKFVKWVSKRR